jgi:hypothetical protein
VSRYVSFQEEFDTEYLASHRDPLFDTREGEFPPPSVGGGGLRSPSCSRARGGFAAWLC